MARYVITYEGGSTESIESNKGLDRMGLISKLALLKKDLPITGIEYLSDGNLEWACTVATTPPPIHIPQLSREDIEFCKTIDILKSSSNIITAIVMEEEDALKILYSRLMKYDITIIECPSKSDIVPDGKFDEYADLRLLVISANETSYKKTDEDKAMAYIMSLLLRLNIEEYEIVSEVGF